MLAITLSDEELGSVLNAGVQEVFKTNLHFGNVKVRADPETGQVRVYMQAGETAEKEPHQAKRTALPPFSDVCNILVEDLDVPYRVAEALYADGINYVGQLIRLKDSDILKYRNVGRTTLNELRHALCLHGLHLDYSPPIGWQPPKGRK